MKNAKKIITALIVGMFAFSAVGCDMIAKTPEGISKSVVAKVNGESITRGELDEAVDQQGIISQIEQEYGANYKSNADAMAALKQQKQNILDNMITEVLFLQKGKEKNLIPSDTELNKEVDKQYQTYKKNYKTDAEWKAALSQAKLTDATFKEQLKKSVKLQKVVAYVEKGITISDAKAKAYYDKNQSNYTQKTNTVNLSHILLKTEAEAQQVEARIKKGEDFATIAKSVSTDTGSKPSGGSLGDIPVNTQDYDATFMAAALKLKAGEVSQPVQTQFGWHVIKCNSKTNYPVKPFDSVKADIKNTLLTQQKQTVLQSTITSWKKAASITKYDKNII